MCQLSNKCPVVRHRPGTICSYAHTSVAREQYKVARNAEELAAARRVEQNRLAELALIEAQEQLAAKEAAKAQAQVESVRVRAEALAQKEQANKFEQQAQANLRESSARDRATQAYLMHRVGILLEPRAFYHKPWFASVIMFVWVVLWGAIFGRSTVLLPWLILGLGIVVIAGSTLLFQHRLAHMESSMVQQNDQQNLRKAASLALTQIEAKAEAADFASALDVGGKSASTTASFDGAKERLDKAVDHWRIATQNENDRTMQVKAYKEIIALAA